MCFAKKRIAMVDKDFKNLKRSFQESQEKLLGSEMLTVYGGAHDDEVCVTNKDCELSCLKGCSQGCAPTKVSGSTKDKKCELSCKKGCSVGSATNYS